MVKGRSGAARGKTEFWKKSEGRRPLRKLVAVNVSVFVHQFSITGIAAGAGK